MRSSLHTSCPNELALSIHLGGESIELPSIELSEDGGSESFTLERQELILRAILQGLPLEQAAGLAGIHRTTVGRWRDKGEQAPDGPYGQFALALAQVEAVFMARMIKEILADREGKVWVSRITLLERRFPREFGRSEKRIHEHGTTATFEGSLREALERRRQRGVTTVTGD